MIRKGYVDTPEGQIPYIEAGSGEPILLLHLAPRSSRMFLPLLPHLEQRYRGIAIDMLGFGHSPPVPMTAGNVDVVDVARNFVHVLDALGIQRAHIFGVHTGAHFAAQMAANWPERCAALVLLGLGMREPGESDSALSALARYSSYPVPKLDGTHVMGLWIRWYQDVLRYWLHARLPLVDAEAPVFASRPMPFRPMTTFLRREELTFIRHGVIDALTMEPNNGMVAYKEMVKVNMPELLRRVVSPTLHLAPDSPFESPFCQRGARVAELVHKGEHATLIGVDEHACELAPEVVADSLTRFLARHPIHPP